MDAEATVRETYHAAIQHDNAGLTGEEHLAGVVRRPTGWFQSAVDENYPALGPPEALLTDAKERQAEREAAGEDDTAALNGAWEDVNFAARYLDYLDRSATAHSALETLAARVRDGQPVVLVCFEAPDKRCHRHLLRERLLASL